MSEARLSEALLHHEAGRIEQAQALYRGILARDPDDADSLHLLGLITAERGNPAAGAALIQRAMAIAPGRAPYHNNLALSYRLLGRGEDAVREYRTAVALRPQSAEIHNNLATTLRDLGRHEEALAHYRQAAEHAPAIAGDLVQPGQRAGRRRAGGGSGGLLSPRHRTEARLCACAGELRPLADDAGAVGGGGGGSGRSGPAGADAGADLEQSRHRAARAGTGRGSGGVLSAGACTGSAVCRLRTTISAACCWSKAAPTRRPAASRRRSPPTRNTARHGSALCMAQLPDPVSHGGGDRRPAAALCGGAREPGGGARGAGSGAVSGGGDRHGAAVLPAVPGRGRSGVAGDVWAAGLRRAGGDGAARRWQRARRRGSASGSASSAASSAGTRSSSCSWRAG